MDRNDPSRDISPAFLDRVASWIERSGEVLVVLRYLRAAGAKDYSLCRTRVEFEDLVASMPVGTDIVVFRDPQLPIRGIVDDEFISSAVASFRDDQEYLLVTMETRPESRVVPFGECDMGRAELRRTLSGLRGVRVALGPYPEFWVDDHEGMTSVSKGGVDEPR